MLDVHAVKKCFAKVSPFLLRGRVVEVRGPIIKASLQGVAIGDLVYIRQKRLNKIVERNSSDDRTQVNCKGWLLSQVVGFTDDVCVMSPLGNPQGVFPGAEVQVRSTTIQIPLGHYLLGTVVDGLGESLVSKQASSLNVRDRKDAPYFEEQPLSPLKRSSIEQPFVTGLRAIDGFLTLGLGQRIAIFAEAGVGKSTLLGRICQCSNADINVIGLIGERSREVKEFLDHTLDEETLKRTIVVVSTSDEAALRRIMAAQLATKVARYFRDAYGYNVLLQIDSLTRLFRAYREVGLAAGEVPVRRGYPPSVFARLPELLEQAGTGVRGSVTALYTVLLSSDVDEDPMVDEVKGITDGHLILRKELAERGQYPAIDVLGSISRLAPKLVEREVHQAGQKLRRLLSRLQHDREYILFGGKPDWELSQAIGLESEILDFLTQQENEVSSFEETKKRLIELARKYHQKEDSL